MPNQISGRLGSEILELSADGGRKSFFVHKNLLVEQSEFLRTAVKQAADRKIDLGCWDSETVSHIVDFLYLHTYKVKTPEPLYPTGPSPEGTISDTSETCSRSDTPDTVRDRSPDSIHRRPLTPLRVLIESHDAQNPAESNPTLAEAEHSYSTLYAMETHDYHCFLFAHAKVYALAQSLGIDDLQGMAYRALAGILDSLQPIGPGSRIAVSSIELLSYVYANTDSSGDQMWKLVSQFAALNFPVLQRMDQMKGLVRQGGELAVDLVEKVCRRLVASESDPETTHRVMSASLRTPSPLFPFRASPPPVLPSWASPPPPHVVPSPFRASPRPLLPPSMLNSTFRASGARSDLNASPPQSPRAPRHTLTNVR